jgi:hypothetical protein
MTHRADPRNYIVGLIALCFWLSLLTLMRAAETDAKSNAGTTAEEQPEEPKNWIELGFGGVKVDGDRAQFEQEHRLPGNEVFGGIQDLHYEHAIGSDVQLTLDGHAIFDTHDYKLELNLSKQELGYIQIGFDEFRSWYDGNGGFFPPNGQFFSPFFPEMHIDRGDVWVELGLRMPDWPEITVRYSHEFRDGQKDSTAWGDTTLTGLSAATRNLAPAFRDIDETRDIFVFDLSKTFGNTDVLLGMRYEHAENDNSLNTWRGAGQVPPMVPGGQRFVTQHQKDDVDLFSGHAITETRFSDSLWFTAGYSYTTGQNDLSGTRVFGNEFDAPFGEVIPTLNFGDHSYLDLAGTAQVDEHVFNANVFWLPVKDLSVLTAFRYTHENRDSSSSFLAFEPEFNLPPFTPQNPQGGFHYGSGVLTFGARSANYDRFAENLELRYTGLADWLFYAQAELEEEYGHVNEFQSSDESRAPLDKDTLFIGQKYSVGANWYPLPRLNLSAQYYHQIASYDNDDLFNSQDQRLIGQDWNTDDANVRITFRPAVPKALGTLSFVTRYDFMRTEIDAQWATDGVPSGAGQTGITTKHMISEAINWNPLARLYLQADVSYVLNQTDTPASQINLIPNTSPTVVDFRNDYWMVTVGGGYIINDKTDLHAQYTFYRANDYFKNSAVAVPYGMGATEHTASATLTRQLTKQVRLLLSYTYFDYTDETLGGHDNYRAHSIFSSLQFRF